LKLEGTKLNNRQTTYSFCIIKAVGEEGMLLMSAILRMDHDTGLLSAATLPLPSLPTNPTQSWLLKRLISVFFEIDLKRTTKCRGEGVF